MKQEICCTNCVGVWEGIQKTDYPGEHLEIKPGKLIKPGCQCDSCGHPLKLDSGVFAVSVWTDGMERYDWEGDYINQEVTP